MITLPIGKSIHEVYQRMIDFVDELVGSADEYIAEQLSIAKNGKGAGS